MDQASLRRDLLPPNYLFPMQSADTLPDDLTQLTILLTGATGTPYEQGLWRLHLRIPTDYPKNPPRAFFKTRIWHPNIDESSGAVCLETLKRDWDSKLTLRDVLITISCLLLNPNPDSALNSTAGSLLQDSYKAFADQARLMTSIHARVPSDLQQRVHEARHRGEEDVLSDGSFDDHSVSFVLGRSRTENPARSTDVSRLPESVTVSHDENADDEENHDPQKENDPSLSPTLVVQKPQVPRKVVLGKRPLSELPIPIEPDTEEMTESERNVAVNISASSSTETGERLRKTPKLTPASKRVKTLAGCEGVLGRGSSGIWTDSQAINFDDKENLKGGDPNAYKPKALNMFVQSIRPIAKDSNALGSAGCKDRGKIQRPPRVGIRRL